MLDESTLEIFVPAARRVGRPPKLMRRKHTQIIIFSENLHKTYQPIQPTTNPITIRRIFRAYFQLPTAFEHFLLLLFCNHFKNSID